MSVYSQAMIYALSGFMSLSGLMAGGAASKFPRRRGPARRAPTPSFLT